MAEARAGRRIGPTLAFGACAAIGIASFAIAMAAGKDARAWHMVQVNWVYWTGLAFAGVSISAILRLGEARWDGSVRRLAEASVGLIPMSLALFAGVAIARTSIGPDVESLAPAKAAWLAPGGLLLRDAAALILMSLVSFAYVRASARPDARPGTGPETAGRLGAWLSRGWRGREAEVERSRRATGMLAPLLLLIYALVFSLLAIDQVMSLDPTWVSTLFPAYVFMTNLYLGWSILAALAAHARRRHPDGVGRGITDDTFHDLGKLMFAFCLLSADFFWSQFLVIWYGNLPEETPFVLRRIRQEPWSFLAMFVLLLCYAAPFVALIFKRIKRNASALAAVGLLVALMMWAERYLLIVPSTWNLPRPKFWYFEISITIGFFGLAGLGYRAALFALPPPAMPVAAPGTAEPSSEANAAATEAGNG